MPEGENGGLGWRAALPVDLQGNESIVAHKEVKDLAADYVKVKGSVNELTTKHAEATTKLGEYEGKLKNALFIPGADAKPEDVEAFNGKIGEYAKKNLIDGKYIPRLKENATEAELKEYLKAIGRPEKPDDYKFEEFKIPEDVKLDAAQAEAFMKNVPALEGWARQVFHAAGLNPAMAKVVRDAYLGMVLKNEQAAAVKTEQEMQAAVEGLKTSWGAEYDKNMEITNREVDRIEKVVPGFKVWAANKGYGRDAMFIKVLNEYARAISDDAFIKGTRAAHDQHEPGKLSYPSMEEKK